MRSKLLKINKADNIFVALDNIFENEVIKIDNEEIIVLNKIPFGHKIANKDIEEGDFIIKYGEIIGTAKKSIKKGEWVHTHNCKTTLSNFNEYNYSPHLLHNNTECNKSFKGYLRKNGKVGVRNEIWILPTVGCVNGIVRNIEKECQNLKKGSIDAIVAFNHPYGCSQVGEDQNNTKKILANIISHPNAGGVLLVGLGCENIGIKDIIDQIPDIQSLNIEVMNCQDTNNELEEGIKLVNKLVEQCETAVRSYVPVSKLIVGLKCGGSDGLSGITANPTVGVFSDLLINQGGTTILTEVPEMFGAEKNLMNRCKDHLTFNKLVKLINDFKKYYIDNNATIYENPSPGNKEGGITTLEDKSLGCTQKSGQSTVVDVLRYGNIVIEKGLNLLEAPGNDMVASTALAASGAQIILFTTGRGTPFACPVPTLKISSNTALYDKKKNWIDFDAGEILKEKSLTESGQDLFDLVIDIASGSLVKSEINGYKDMAIFKKGVTL